MRGAISFIFFLLLIVPSLSAVGSLNIVAAHAGPVWFKEGVFVEYHDPMAGDLTFSNGTWYFIYPEVDATFRWECVELAGDVARLTLSVNYEGVYSRTVEVLVDLRTRDLTLNGTLLGKTALWLKAYPKEGEKIVLVGKAPNYVYGKAKFVGSFVMSTPQGDQSVYDVEYVDGMGEIRPSATYDLDTGVLLCCPVAGDAALLALGLWWLDVTFCMSATNIDLGPPSLRPLLAMGLLIAIPACTFVALSVLIYRRRRRLRRLARR